MATPGGHGRAGGPGLVRLDAETSFRRSENSGQEDGITFALFNLVASLGFAAAGACALALTLPSRRHAPLPPAGALIAGAALLFFAADEGLELHDRWGRWLWTEHGVTAPGPIEHVDDLIVLAYGGAAVIAVAALLPRLRRHPPLLAGVLACGALFGVATLLDTRGGYGTWIHMLEELLEAGGAAVLAAAAWREARLHVAMRAPRRLREARDAQRQPPDHAPATIDGTPGGG